MSRQDCRLVSVRAELHVSGETTLPAWVCAIGARTARLCLRDTDAIAVRDNALAGGSVRWRLGVHHDEDWVAVEDVRLGRAHGGGDTAIRTVFLTHAEPVRGTEPAGVEIPPTVVAVDGRRGLQVCRSLPGLQGAEVVLARELRDSAAVGALVLDCSPGREPDMEAIRGVVQRFPRLRPVLLAAGDATSERWSDLVLSGTVFFAASGWPEPCRLAPLVVAALENAVFRQAFLELAGQQEHDPEFPTLAWYDAAIPSRRRAAQEMLHHLAALADRRIPELTATVYAYDEWAEVLVGPRRPQQADGLAESAAVGLVAYAARTGTALLEEQVEKTALFDAELDLRPGAGHGLIAVPIRDLVGTVFGVLACRPPDDHGHLRPSLLHHCPIVGE